MKHVVLALVLAVSACGEARPDRLHELEVHLMAPCCWRQTLADHVSPTADQLRADLAARVAAGESSAAIEQAYVATYGPRILALERDPRGVIGTITAIAAALGLLALVLVLRRKVRRAPPSMAPTARDEDAEARLDDELALVD